MREGTEGEVYERHVSSELSRFTNALEEYNDCSTVPKFAKSQEGDAEQVEFILQLLGDGDLRNTVATKFDKLRAGNLHTNGWQLLIRSNLEACCKR